ncbi:MAG: ABC transporter permease [Verrucomicrobia bacterium]|nr:ABC transporter permease [Verrucomicrobiota bacterium]
MNDLKFAFRQLLKNPGFTAVAVLTLALGIGANTAMFSVVNAVLLRPLPFTDPERLMFVEGKDWRVVSGGDFNDVNTQSRSFSHLAAFFGNATFNLSGGKEPDRVSAARVSATLLPTLGVQPVRGRNFTGEEDRDGGEKVVLLSYGLWQRKFGADEGIVGRTVKLDGVSHTVVGVLPPSFNFPPNKELFMPLALSPSELNSYGMYSFTVLARLKPDVSPSQADAELRTIIRRERPDFADPGSFPDFRKTWSVRLVGVHEAMVGNVRKMMVVLMSAVGFVVLIACANLANLLLASATRRQKEIAVRLSLGATRRRVIEQFLTESLLLAILGEFAGLFLAYSAIALINSWLPANLLRIGEIGLDGRVLGFTTALALLAGFLFGTLPAWRASQTTLTDALKSGSHTASSGFGQQRMRALLVVSQVALTMVLLTGAGLLIKSFVRLQNTPLGFRSEQLLTARVTLPSSTYTNAQQRLNFAQRLLEEVRRQPGLREAALTSQLPFAWGNQSFGITIDRKAESEGNMPNAHFRSITSEYLRVMGIPLLKGREFSNSDHERAPMVTLINETMAKKYWPNADPIGQRIQETSNEPVWREIVGIVGSVRHEAREREPEPEMFVPWSQVPDMTLNLAVRTQLEPSSVGGALRSAVAGFDPELPLFDVRTMEARLSDSVAQPRFRTALLGAFAAIALMMAAIGIYAVMAFSVAQRTHELGLRVALGAQRRDVISLVLRQGAAIAGLGIVIGLAVAFALTRVLVTLLYEVKPTDPLTFLAVPLMLVGVVFLACWLPARRAARIDPMEALRYE